MPYIDRIYLAIMTMVVVAVAALAMMLAAHARDLGQWGNNDPAVTQWYRSLMQPDAPGVSCCGEADAYWCDEIHVRDGKTYCNVTDDRDDGPRMRPHIDAGTEIAIPDTKLMDGKITGGNPTGHSIAFISRSGFVYCFILNSGT